MMLDDEITHWRTWVGRTEVRTETLDPDASRRFAAAVGGSLDVEWAQPSLGHWAFFLAITPDDAIGPDGHARRGGFLPPVTLPRRMFAAGEFTFAAPLTLGRPATRRSTVAAVTHRRGRSGDLVIVDIDHAIEQDGDDRVTERQTLIYRAAGDPTPPVVPAAIVPSGEVWTPGAVELFRFSAATFNGHRIHYDQPYVTATEGYPGLVVHGPFIAARLHARATRHGRAARRFAFRALAPTFVDQSIILADGPIDGAVTATRCDGVAAMTATAEY